MEPIVSRIPLDSIGNLRVPLNLPQTSTKRQLFTARTDGVPTTQNFRTLAQVLNNAEDKPEFMIQHAPAYFRFVVWEQDQSIIPTPLIHSSLFGASSTRWTTDTELTYHATNADDFSMLSLGPSLAQHDLDVWLGVLRLCKNQDAPFDFTQLNMAKLGRLMGRGRLGGSGRVNLKNRLSKLASVNLFIANSQHMFLTPLVHTTPSLTKLSIPSPIIWLTNLYGHTKINLIERAMITPSLQKWIYTFVQAHNSMYTYHFSTILPLLGGHGTSRAYNKFQFKNYLQDLENKKLIKVGKMQGEEKILIERKEDLEDTGEDGLPREPIF